MPRFAPPPTLKVHLTRRQRSSSLRSTDGKVSYRIELAADGAIYYSDNTSGPLRRTRIRVPAERWVAFRKHLDAARVWSWRAQYIDLAVVDGVGWEFQVAYRDRSTASRGSNAHPPKRQFEQFLAAVRELTGGKPFE